MLFRAAASCLFLAVGLSSALPFRHFIAILTTVMRRWFSRPILALTFGLLLAVGSVVSAVQANDMVLSSATSGCMDASAAKCCDNCGSDDSVFYKGFCLPTCTGGTFGVLPVRTTLATANQPVMLDTTWPTSFSLAFSPDPDPPRPLDLA
jgi:hypothetical protein